MINAAFNLQTWKFGIIQTLCVQCSPFKICLAQASKLTVMSDVFEPPKNRNLYSLVYIFNKLICLYVDCSKANTSLALLM